MNIISEIKNCIVLSVFVAFSAVTLPVSTSGLKASSTVPYVYFDDAGLPSQDHSFTLTRLAGMALDLLVPPARAADITITDPDPSIIFDDDTGVGNDWLIRGREEFFSIVDVVGGGEVLEVIPSGNSNNSISIDSAGDMRLANDAIMIDRSSGNIGIGIFPIDDLHIFDSTPALILHDSTDSESMSVQFNSDLFKIRDNNNNAIVEIHEDAPDRSLHIDAAGNVGIGTLPATGVDLHILDPDTPGIRLDDGFEGIWDIKEQSNDLSFINVTDGLAHLRIADGGGNVGIGSLTPEAPLHVSRNDGTAKILVTEVNAVEAPRELFKLSNAGNTKFIIANTQAVDPSEWGFTNNGDDFRISYQGSGVVEMQVFEGGNVNIVGTLTEGSDRAAKTNIETINPDDVLNKVIGMPISRWQYKTTEGVDHMGPMAQDFYSAFGLGDTDKGIASLDSGGVALASIQALAARNEALEQQNQALKAGHRELLQAYHQQSALLEEIMQQQLALQQQLSDLLGDQSEGIAMTAIH